MLGGSPGVGVVRPIIRRPGAAVVLPRADSRLILEDDLVKR